MKQKQVVKSIRAAFGFNAIEKSIVDAVDGTISAGVTLATLCRAFVATKGDVKALLQKLRTFALDNVDTVVSVRDLKVGNDEQKKAGRRFATLQTTFWRIGLEDATPAQKAVAEKAAKKATATKQAAAKVAVIESITESPKAILKLVKVQVAALQKKEKAPFDIPAAIAAWEALGAVYK